MAKQIRFFALVVVSLAAGWSLAQTKDAKPAGDDPAPRKVVIAEEFVLMGKDGKQRLFINLNKDGDPTIVLLDRNGKVRANLGLNTDGRPSLSLMDSGQILFWDKMDELRLVLQPKDLPTVPQLAAPEREEEKGDSQQHYASGLIFYSKGDHMNARREWKKALALDPTNSDAKAGIERIDMMNLDKSGRTP